MRLFFVAICLITLSACSAIQQDKSTPPEFFKLVQQFPDTVNKSIKFDASIIASSLMDFSQGKPLVIVPASNGVIAALDSETGRMEWQLHAPTPEGQEVELVATPVKIGDKLVISYQCNKKGVRTSRDSHRLAVIDLKNKSIDDSFPVLDLYAEKPGSDPGSIVKFNANTAFSHAALKHIDKSGTDLGYVYAAFGGAQDAQPFHGWLFEIDMDAWQQSKKGATKTAIANVFLTTPETKCPLNEENGSGTTEMLCAGGIWTPPGIQVYPDDTGVELIVPTGNGQIDIARHDYANTLMRMKPGLQFDPDCDKALCMNFNPINPDEACMASCKNLFIPRLASGNAPVKPVSGECDKFSFSRCLAWMDYDLGASAPVKVDLGNEHSVLVQPGKDGGVYLIDAEHLGTLYDRLQIVEVCGTATDPCRLVWAGMIVTQPVQATINNEPIVVIPTFVADKTHAAGLVALKIVLENDKPKFKRFWQFPKPSSPEALQAFRSHPSLPVLYTPEGSTEPVVWIVDIGKHGTLYGVRVKDGVVVAKQLLQGAGRQLSMPLIYNNHVYVASIMPNTGEAMIEGFRIEPIK